MRECGASFGNVLIVKRVILCKNESCAKVRKALDHEAVSSGTEESRSEKGEWVPMVIYR